MSEKDPLYENLFQEALRMFEHGADAEAIKTHLIRKTDDSVLIAVVIKEAKNKHYDTLRKEGVTKIFIGVVLIGTGFVITFFNYHSNKSIDMAMYGFTTAGLISLGWGCYKILG